MPAAYSPERRQQLWSSCERFLSGHGPRRIPSELAALAQAAPCALNPTACEQKPGNTGGEIGTAVESSVQGPAEPGADGLRNPRPRGGS